MINAADYGVPQVWKRVILFAVSKDFAGVSSASSLLQDVLLIAGKEQRKQFHLSTDRYVNVEEAMSDLSGDENAIAPEFPNYKTCKYRPAVSAYQKLMRKNWSGNFHRSIELRVCPTASWTILLTRAAGRTFDVVAWVAQRLPIWNCIRPPSCARYFMVLLKSDLSWRATTGGTDIFVLCSTSAHLSSDRWVRGISFAYMCRSMGWYWFPCFTIPKKPSSPYSSRTRRNVSIEYCNTHEPRCTSIY